MRLPGELHLALLQAAHALYVEQETFTWRDLAVRAQVGWLKARRTVENMGNLDVLERVGHERRPHSRRWMTLYSLPAAARPAAPWDETSLDLVTRSWACGVAVAACVAIEEAAMP